MHSSLFLLSLCSAVIASPAPLSTNAQAAASGYAALPSSTLSGTRPLSTDTNSVTFSNASEDSSPNAGAKVLIPTIHWEHDGDDLSHLDPKPDHSVYFTFDGTANADTSHFFLSANMTLKGPSVLLDHSNHVTSINCTNSSIAVGFGSQDGYDAAKSAWKGGNFSIATNTDDCGLLNAQHSYWAVKKLNFADDALKINAIVGSELSLANHSDAMSTQWGTWQPSNGANSTGCGTALPNDGLPTADCGDFDWDLQLDNQIGYIDCDVETDPSCWQKLIQSNSSSSRPSSAVPSALITPSPALEARNIGDFFNSLGSDISTAVSHVSSEVSHLVEGSTTVTFDIGVTLPAATATPSYDKSAPWPSALELVSAGGSKGPVSGNMKVYCVGCYVKGKVHVQGNAAWKGLDVTSLTADFSGDIEAQMALGLTADGQATASHQMTLFSDAISPFSIPDIIEVGPIVSLDISGQAQLTMKGAVEVGVTLSVPDFKASVDFLDGSKSKKDGFQPKWTKVLDAKADIGLSATIGVPLSIGLGVKIPPVNFDKEAKLVDTPSITANLTTSVGSGGAGFSSDCKGLDFTLSFDNDITFNAFDVANIPIFDWKDQLYSTCVSVSGLGGAVSTSTTAGAPATRVTAISIASQSNGSGGGGFFGMLTSVFSHQSAQAAKSSSVAASAAASVVTTAQPQVTGDAIMCGLLFKGIAGCPLLYASATSQAVSGSAALLSQPSRTASSAVRSVMSSAESSRAAISSLVKSQAAGLPSDTLMTVHRSVSQVPSSKINAPSYKASLSSMPSAGAPSSKVPSSEASSVVAPIAQVSTSEAPSVIAPVSRAISSGIAEASGRPQAPYGNSTAQLPTNMTSDGTLRLIDYTMSFKLNIDNEGNMRMAGLEDAGVSTFKDHDKMAFGDTTGRYLFYYQDTMSKYGVSRLRAATPQRLPKTAGLVSLGAEHGDGNVHQYMALTPGQQSFALITCNYQDQRPSRIFVAEDILKGAEILQQESLRWTITGGAISGCAPIPWLEAGFA